MMKANALIPIVEPLQIIDVSVSNVCPAKAIRSYSQVTQ